MLKICKESVNNQGVVANTCNPCFRPSLCSRTPFYCFCSFAQGFSGFKLIADIFVLGLDMCTTNSACVCGGQRLVKCGLLHSPPQFLEQELSLNLKLMARLLWASSLTIEPFPQPSIYFFVVGFGVCVHTHACVSWFMYLWEARVLALGPFSHSLVYDTASCIIEMTYLT